MNAVIEYFKSVSTGRLTRPLSHRLGLDPASVPAIRNQPPHSQQGLSFVLERVPNPYPFYSYKSQIFISRLGFSMCAAQIPAASAAGPRNGLPVDNA